MTLDELNHLDVPPAEREFLRCCGSTRWAAAMTAARPFAGLDAVRDRSARIWASLAPADWREAFAAHPKIGEQRQVSAWSTAEQAGMASADNDVRVRLAALNAAYETRFGYIFIVCAAGRTSDEMLALLDARLKNDPVVELPIAAAEQGRITALRLAKLLDVHQ
jgi:2-oxo-4-hydroxy-4-carboxy-5-ureidoimidazoline decarboxylase